MGFKYYHDDVSKTVYRVEYPVQVIEKMDKKGRRIGWTLQAEIVLTCADNVRSRNDGGWKYPGVKYPQESYDAKETHQQVVEFFERQHIPNCPEIDASDYQRLQSQYQSLANSNKEK